MAEEVRTETYNKTKQKWSIGKHFENIDLDIVKLEIYEAETDKILLEMTWNAKDFFKQMLDLQYEYAK